MTETQIQSAVKQFRGSTPVERADILAHVESIAKFDLSRERRESAIALLKNLQAAQTEILQKDQAFTELQKQVENLSHEVQNIQQGSGQLYSREVVKINVSPFVKPVLILSAGGAVIYFVGIPVLAGVGIATFCGWLALSGLIGGGGKKEVIAEKEPGPGGQMNINIQDNHGNIIINMSQNGDANFIN